MNFQHVYAGIHAEIAGARHEYWSYYASRPVEVILAAGRKAKDENTPSKTPCAHCWITFFRRFRN